MSRSRKKTAGSVKRRTQSNNNRAPGSNKKTSRRRTTTGTDTHSRAGTAPQSRQRGGNASRNANAPIRDTDENKVLLLFNKPYNVLCQFTDDNDRETLAKYIDIPDVYAAGRLDRDSEGLLLLTNDGILQHRISHPDFKLPKTYLVQLEGIPEKNALEKLRNGIKLNDGMSAPAEAALVDEPDWLWPRNPPIRFRKDKPTSWIELTITEGRNRQVRRMTAAVGHPTLRLVRIRIGAYSLGTLQPGELQES